MPLKLPELRLTESAPLSRALAAEALGTGVLVAAVVGSGIMAERLATDPALTLLANTVPTGAILVVLITILGPISGAHLNPAVTLVFAVRRTIRWNACGLYWVVQIIGGMLGTMLAHLMFDAPVISAAQHVRSGGAQWLSEGVATFGLVLVILGGLAVQQRAIPWLVGLYITAAYWFTASTSFANPAVTIARSFTASFAGIRLMDTPGFIVAQFVGALLAAAVAGWLWQVRPE